jgi:hypothetical protein
LERCSEHSGFPWASLSREFSGLRLQRAILFEKKKTSWSTALKQAYPAARAGKAKLIRSFMDTLLYKVFCDALLILNTDTEGLTRDYTQFKQKFRITFPIASRRAPGRQPTGEGDKIAVHFAKRHAILLPRIRQVRKFVDELKQQGMNDSRILRNIAARFKDDWIPFVISGDAFQELLANASEGGTMKNVSIAGRWAPWQLTISVIGCEEQKRNPRQQPLRPNTIHRIVMHGQKILHLRQQK